MKRTFLPLVASVAFAAAAQVIIESQSVVLTRTRVRTETIFRNSAETGELLEVEIRTVDIIRSGTNEVKRLPGPTIMLTPEQMKNTLPGFGQIQATFAEAATRLMTNSYQP